MGNQLSFLITRNKPIHRGEKNILLLIWFVNADRRMDAVPNYGRSAGGGESRPGYMCQLTSVSNGRMDPRHDFVDDPRYDYYARDWTCPAGKVHRDSYERDWSDSLPARRPNNRNNWPLATSFSPSDSSRRPLEPPLFTEDTRSYYPPERFAPTRNRPGEYNYYPTTDRQRPWGSYLPHRPDYNGIGQHRYYYGSQNGDRDYYPNRRVDDQWIWRHRPPGPNDIVKPNSGVTYGGSYGYGTNYYPYQRSKDHSARDHYDYWPKTHGPPRKPSVPDQQDRHYGSNYGPAYGYHSVQGSLADSYRPTWKPPHRRTWLGSDPKDCSIRSLMGFKITRKIVAASHVTANLEECEMLCSARRDCFSFAYRYSLVATAPTDNCLLSNVPFDKLDFYTDLEPDRDYDIYAVIGDPKQCQEVSPKPGSGQVIPHRRSPEGKIKQFASLFLLLFGIQTQASYFEDRRMFLESPKWLWNPTESNTEKNSSGKWSGRVPDSLYHCAPLYLQKLLVQVCPIDCIRP